MKYRDAKAAKVKNFVWRTNDKRSLRPKEMTTEHLLNSLKMLHFNSDPKTFKGINFKKWPSIQDWDITYRRRAREEFIKELRTRPEFDEKDLFTVLL